MDYVQGGLGTNIGGSAQTLGVLVLQNGALYFISSSNHKVLRYLYAFSQDNVLNRNPKISIANITHKILNDALR